MDGVPARGITPEEERAMIAEMGPHWSFNASLGAFTHSYLAPFARSVWSDAAGADLPWPPGSFMEVLALQLQKVGLKRSSRTVVTVPKVPGRSLLAMSLLPAWYLANGARNGRSMLLAARTERLARAYRARFQAVMDMPRIDHRRQRAFADTSPYSNYGPTSVARWGRVGSPLRSTKPLTDLILCDPLTPEELRDNDKCAALLQWIDAARRQGRTGEDYPSTLLAVEKVEDGDLIDRLTDVGWNHIDLPKHADGKTTFEISAATSISPAAGTRLVPLPADPAVRMRLEAQGLSAVEIEVLLT
jgi:hypothetical protein